MFKRGYILLVIANTCVHKSTTAKICRFTESDKDILEKVRKDMVGGPSIVFTRKALVAETFVRIHQTGAKPLSELMLVSFILCLCVKQCLLVRTRDGSQIRNLVNLTRVKATRGVSKTWYCQIFSESDHIVKWKVSMQRVHRKKAAYSVDGVCGHYKTVFEAMGCYHYFYPFQKTRPSLIEEEFW